MTSEKKKMSNKINAQRSTGPRTPEGKDRAAGNSLRHGLTAVDVLIPGEDPEEFGELQEALLHDFDPVGPYQIILVEELAALKWRQRRAMRLESSVLKMEMNRAQYREVVRDLTPSYTYTGPPIEGEFHKLDPPPTPEQQEELLARLKIVQEAMSNDSACNAYLRSTSGEDELGKLTRYETTVERAYYRKLSELERDQMRRAGKQVDAPIVVAVDVNHSPQQGRAEVKLEDTVIDAEICETNPPSSAGGPGPATTVSEQEPKEGRTKTAPTAAEPLRPKCETEPNPTPALFTRDRYTFGR
jgi:hypothetical protein